MLSASRFRRDRRDVLEHSGDVARVDTEFGPVNIAGLAEPDLLPLLEPEAVASDTGGGDTLELPALALATCAVPLAFASTALPLSAAFPAFAPPPTSLSKSNPSNNASVLFVRGGLNALCRVGNAPLFGTWDAKPKGE